jgi:hypothetical protein
LKGHPKPARSFQRSGEALKGWFERPCGAFKGGYGRFKSPSNGRLEPLNTRGGGVQKAPLSFEIRVFPLWGPRTPGGPRKGKGRASRFTWGRGPKEASKRGGAPFKGSGRPLNGLGGGGGPDLWSLVRVCASMHAHPCTAMYGDVRPCTGMHARPCTGMYGGARRCTPLYARACTPLHPPCTAVHARPCTGMYGGVRPCMLGHVRPCTAAHARVRRCTVEGASRGERGTCMATL